MEKKKFQMPHTYIIIFWGYPGSRIADLFHSVRKV